MIGFAGAPRDARGVGETTRTRTRAGLAIGAVVSSVPHGYSLAFGAFGSLTIWLFAFTSGGM